VHFNRFVDAFHGKTAKSISREALRLVQLPKKAMKKAFIFSILACGLFIGTNAQETNAGGNSYRNFPLVISLQCHALALPFRDMKANFSNLGIGIGTEISLNGKHNWTQQVTGIWFRNRAIGNGLGFYTQTAWRPEIASGFYTEAKGGIGYLYAFRPVESFRHEHGKWVSVGHRGKGLLTLPVGISFGYNTQVSGVNVSPFVSYQFMLVTGYNKSVPLIPETLIQAGSRWHIK
jgi:hypothetical protein